MAKQTRGTNVRSKTKKAPARKAASRPSRPAARSLKGAAKRPVVKKPGKSTPTRAVAPPKRMSPVRPVEPPAPPPPPAAPVPPRKPGFYEAVAIYERGVQGLQRHDFAGAAELFRTVIER